MGGVEIDKMNKHIKTHDELRLWALVF